MIDDVDLQAPAAESVKDDDKKLDHDDKQNPHVHPELVTFSSDKTGETVTLDDADLLNRHFLLPPEEDGTRHRAQIVGIDRNFKHPKHSSEQHTKFRLKTNDDEFNEHIACAKMLSFIEDNFLQPQDGQCWTMRRIVAHSR